MEDNNYMIEKGFEPISSDQMYQIENKGESEYHMKKILMMENAGNRIADFLINEFKEKLIESSIVAICGSGNNGGDALVALRHLSGHILSKEHNKKNRNLSVVLLARRDGLKTHESNMNWKIIEKMDSIQKFTLESSSLLEIENVIDSSSIIIDGIFGTGIKGSINEPLFNVMNKINQRRTTSHILSVDIPSGLNPDTGEIQNIVISADTTITFHRLKNGMLKNSKVCGNIIVKKIGIPYEVEKEVI